MHEQCTIRLASQLLSPTVQSPLNHTFNSVTTLAVPSHLTHGDGSGQLLHESGRLHVLWDLGAVELQAL